MNPATAARRKTLHGEGWLWYAVLGAGVVLAMPDEARADEASDLCLADSIEGQVLKNHGQLTRAREYLVRCSEAPCDERMRARCAQWRDELLAATPVLSIRTLDDLGQPVRESTTRLDGALIDPAKPVDVDPGSHELRVEHAGRVAVLSLEPKPGPQPVTLTLDLRDKVPARPTPRAVYWLAGTTGVALASLAALSIGTLVQQSNLRGCSPYCSPSTQGTLDGIEVGADLSLGVAAAAALGAAIVYLARPTVFKDVRLTYRAVTWTF